MTTRQLLFCTLSLFLALPVMAATSNTGGPNWGALPGTHKPQFHGECCYTARAVHGLTGGGVGNVSSGKVCNLAGVWQYNLTLHSGAWIRYRLTEKQRKGNNLIIYVFQRYRTPGGRHGVLFFDPVHRRLEMYSLFRTQYPYGMGYSVGTVSPDCRHVSLTSHGQDFGVDRQSMVLLGK